MRFFYVTLPLFWVFVFQCGRHLVPSRHPLFPFERTGNRGPCAFSFFYTASLLVIRFQFAAAIFIPLAPPRLVVVIVLYFVSGKENFLKFYQMLNPFSKFYFPLPFVLKILQS